MNDSRIQDDTACRVKQAFACFALLVVGLLLWHGPVLVGTQVFAGGDLVNQFIPIRIGQLHRGWFAGWQPETFSGIPLAGEIQFSQFYPFDWLLLLGFAVERVFSTLTLLHTLIGGMGFYFFARQRLRFPAATLAAFIWAFSAFQQLRIAAGVIPFTYSFAWIPWMMLAAEKQSLTRGPGLKWCGILALLGAMQLGIGAVQIVQITWVGLFLWTMGRVVIPAEGENRIGILGGFAAASILTLGIAAPVLAPTIEMSSQWFPRAQEDVWGYVSDGSLSWIGILTWFFPDFFGSASIENVFYFLRYGYHELNAFVGVLPVVFSVFLMTLAPTILKSGRQQKRWFQGCLFLAAFGFLVALGSNGFLFRPLVALVPTFDLFRVPARWILWTVFSVSLAAGWGFQLLCDAVDSEEVDKRLQRWIAVSAVILFIAALFRVSIALIYRTLGHGDIIENPEASSLTMDFAAGSITWFITLGFIVCILGVLLLKRKLSTRTIMVFFILIAIADLLKFWIPFQQPIPSGVVPSQIRSEAEFHRIASDAFRDYFFPESQTVSTLREIADGRLHYDDSLPGFSHDEFNRELLSERPVYYGLEMTRGYRQLHLKGYSDDYYSSFVLAPDKISSAFLSSDDPNDRRFLDAYNVSYFLAYAHPRFDVVIARNGLGEPIPVNAIGMLAVPNPHARGWAWVSDKESFLDAEPDSATGSASLSKRSATRWAGTAKLTKPGWLHLSSPEYSAWNLVASKGDLVAEPVDSRSVYLPEAGEWTFTRTYRNAALQPLPLGLSIAAIVAALAFILAGFIGRTKIPVTAAEE